MTSLGLLLWIALGLLAQLGIALGIAFWRHWGAYRTLRARAEGDLSGIAPGISGARIPGPEAWTGFRPFKVTRRVMEDGLQSVCSFYLEPEDGKALPGFLPGQFLTFRLEIPEAEGRLEQVIRCYSLSDAPDPERYRVSIKRVPAPRDSGLPPGRSSNYFHDQVAVGTTLQVRAPAGHFFCIPDDTPIVLIGGGIGITPMLSMINGSLASAPGREIWLFYGVRNSGEVVMEAHLTALAAAHPNVHLHLCFSDPLPRDEQGRDYQHRGRVDVALLRLSLPLKPFHFYICGPGPMLETLVPALEEWGIPGGRIHFEAFGPASIKRQGAPAESGSEEADGVTVRFAKSGKQFTWRPAAGSLLDFAEANGVAVNSGCRAGGCGSCQTRITSGEVAYRQTPDYDPEPGTCLLCVCAPKSDLTLEA